MADTVIRFRCTEEEKAEVQRLADKLAGGNVSGLLRQLLQKSEEGQHEEALLRGI